MNTELRNSVAAILVKVQNSGVDYADDISTPVSLVLAEATDHILNLLTQARIDELEKLELPTYDHSICLDPMTCIGYQNAESDLSNIKRIRIKELEDE